MGAVSGSGVQITHRTPEFLCSGLPDLRGFCSACLFLLPRGCLGAVETVTRPLGAAPRPVAVHFVWRWCEYNHTASARAASVSVVISGCDDGGLSRLTVLLLRGAEGQLSAGQVRYSRQDCSPAPFRIFRR